eukprot:TRINITY_DN376_c0_g1_i1.p1 TRINITY_DN376_c0_g1~~TRINITY_DN376_c0_g1_i1.p1  ORF type:complete len:123 (-),score=17.76 TRINITY_DN376_c0_g1_i1:83-451(-)
MPKFVLLVLLSVACAVTMAQNEPKVQYFKAGPKESCETYCENRGGRCVSDISNIDVEETMHKVGKCGESFDTFRLSFEPIWDWRNSCIGVSLKKLKCHTWSNNPDDRRFCPCIIGGAPASDL